MSGERRPKRKLAVALGYTPEMEAPKVLAKGKGAVAEKLIEKARELGIPLQEDASLAEVLSRLDIDREIPPELYEIVAQILSFVYRTDRRAKEKAVEIGLAE